MIIDKIEFNEPIDIIYTTYLEDLCKYYDDDPKWVIKHLICIAHNEKIKKEEKNETKNIINTI